MSLDDVVELQITAQTIFPDRPSFKTPLFAAYHTKWPARYKVYSSLSELEADGFATYSAVYLMAQTWLSQQPVPKRFVVGRRALPFTKTIRLYPLITTEGFVYTFVVTDTVGVDHTFTVTVGAAATTSTVSEQFETAAGLLSLTGITFSHTGSNTYVEATATAGLLFDFSELPDGTTLKVADMTADPGIATDLAAIYAANSKLWYPIVLDSRSEAEVEAAAAWVETVRKIVLATSTDTDITDSGVTNDLASDLVASGYARTKLFYYSKSLLAWPELALLGQVLKKPEGSYTCEFKRLVGIPVDELSTAQTTALGLDSETKGKRCGYYISIGGLSMVRMTMVPGGDWLDIVIGTDWLFATIQIDAFALLAQMDKVAFEDTDIALVKGAIDNSLAKGVKQRLLAKGTTFTEVPLAEDVDPSDRAGRVLPGIEFGARLAGSIQKLKIHGTLTS